MKKFILLFLLFLSVSTFGQEEQSKDGVHTPKRMAIKNFQKGWKVDAEVGYAHSLLHSESKLKLNLITRYEFNPYFGLGVGVGHRNVLKDEFYTAFFLHTKVNFSRRPVKPYFLLNLGYAFRRVCDTEGGGRILSPALGLSFPFVSKMRMNVGLSLELQAEETEHYSRYSSEENKVTLGLNVGVTF